MCTLFVVNGFSLKSIAIRKRGNILSCDGSESLKPAVAHDAGVARYFDENVLKTKLEAERSASFVFPGNYSLRRVEIVKAARLGDRATIPEHNENTETSRQFDHISASRLELISFRHPSTALRVRLLRETRQLGELVAKLSTLRCGANYCDGGTTGW